MVKKITFLAFIFLFLLGIGLFWNNTSIFTSSGLDQIFWQLRFPRMMTAVFAGGSVALCGLLMQSYFQNPLAGPYVLGVHNGATLCVALWYIFFDQIVNGGHWFSFFGPVSSAIFGSVLMVVVMSSLSIKLNSKVLLIIFGLFFSQFVSGILTVVLNFADESKVKSIIVWSFGSFQRTTLLQIIPIMIGSLFPLIFSLFLSPHLDMLNLGEVYSISSGLNFKRLSFLVVILTGFSTGIIVAYCGPIAFIGLAAIYLAKMIFKTEAHNILIPSSYLLGAIMAVSAEVVNIIVSPISLPLNAILGILGAPIIILFIYRERFQFWSA